ncbi:hypothetical protein A4A49_61011, partial [Nicotiana attenuata]
TIPSSIVLDHNHPLYLHASDGPGSIRAMKVALLGKNKLCLVDGSTLKEDLGPNLGSQWDRCNAIRVWAGFKERFDKVNASRLYYLHKEIFTLTQGISSASIYFTKLKDLWAEYDSILPPPTTATEYIEQPEYQRPLQFLMGLNDNFEQARSHILLMPSLPSIDKAYAMVVQEESRKSFAGGTYGQGGLNDPTALFTAQSTSKPRRNYMCNKTWHLKENCYKIIGYPSDFKQKKKKANVVMMDGSARQGVIASPNTSMYQSSSNVEPAQVFTKEQYNQLLQLLNKGSTAGTSANMEVDTGATNHMTGDKSLLKNETSVGNSGQVQLPTGDSASISHMGECQLTGGDVLKDVLCVPTFKFNLMSASKVTEDLKCSVTFFPKCCIFQDLLSGRVKEIGRREEDLYILSTTL